MEFKRKQNDKTIKLATFRHQAKETKAVVIGIHQFGFHSGYFAHVGHGLSQANITTVTFDLAGYGKSEGDRFFVNSV